MIIGNGSIASMLNDREGFLFFASGVSNSQTVDPRQFIRELLLMKEQPLNLCLVYFSTISVFEKKSDYTIHKLKMEDYIRKTFHDFVIIRLGNIWEDTNPRTFINSIKEKRRFGHYVEIRDEYKYMISKEQLNFITDNLPRTGKHEISVFGEALKVAECLKR